MNPRLASAMLLLLSLLYVPGVAATPDQQREKIRTQSRDVLENLYRERPQARGHLESAYGFATFRNLGVKLGAAGGGRGRGLAVRQSPHSEIFMRFVELQAGVGAGIKRYDLVFLFASREAFNEFVDKGWEASGQTTVALQHQDVGDSLDGAISISPGVWLYQITSSGLVAEMTLKGSKYFRDPKLN